VRANAGAAVAEVQEYLLESAPELAGQVTVCGAVKALDSGEVEWLDVARTSLPQKYPG